MLDLLRTTIGVLPASEGPGRDEVPAVAVRPLGREQDLERPVVFEFQAAQRLGEAARVLSAEEGALQLRYLQTLAEIATEGNSTTIFPVPIDTLTPFYEAAKRASGLGS